MTGRLVVLGDALLDVDLVGTSQRLAPDAPVPVVDDIDDRPRPGGAALAALLAARTGADVVLLAPLADDEAAARLRRTLALLAPTVRLIAIPWSGSTPVKTRVRVSGQSLLRLDTGGALGTVGELPAEAVEALGNATAILVADYGRGTTSAPSVRAALTQLLPRTPIVWDPHPRGATPVPGVRMVTPNLTEALRFTAGELQGSPVTAGARAAEELVAQWHAGAVAVTLGARGALLSYGQGAPMVVPAPMVAGGDPCGAGDCFAAAAAVVLANGGLPSEAIQAAVSAAADFVSAGGAAAVSAAPAPNVGAGDGRLADGEASSLVSHGEGPVVDVVARTRATGGTVVATGGCFDLLHAGHVATLEAARALGDCLVVCLNSDTSVRRLKGADRPLQTAQDRARVLKALVPVDAVVIFDEDTPHEVLKTVRPDIWAKGGDYSGMDLPETQVLQAWGGRAVVLPYIDGRSTSSLVAQARSGRNGQFLRPKDPAN